MSVTNGARQFLVKLCTKNYENPSIFVKVTAKKSVAPFFWTRYIYIYIYILLARVFRAEIVGD